MKNIILLHGAIGASDQLIPLSEELSKAGFNCYKFDFSGHGHSAFKSEFGIKTFSKELKEFITINKLCKPDIFGYSMGGFVALLTAFHNPELIGKIITLGTKFNWSPEIASKEIQMINPETIEEKVPKFAEILKKRHGEKWKELLMKTAEMMLQLGNANFLPSEVFLNIHNRVALGLAENDNMVSKEETNHAASLLPNSTQFTVLSAKHPIETVGVSQLAGIIRSLL